MTDRELMQQALDALERGETKLRYEAITALRERLAQPEQEPVAWVSESENLLSWDKLYDHMTPLYTVPRQWQGLTEAEKVNVAISCGCADVAWVNFADAIEAKLKERNA